MSEIIDITDKCTFTPEQGTQLYDNTKLKISYMDETTGENFNIVKNINVYPRSEFNSPYKISDNVNDCSYMFNECTNFDQPIKIGPNVDNCAYMFYNCRNFNSPVNIKFVGKEERLNWVDVSNMFERCVNFDQPVTFPDTAIMSHYGTFERCDNLNKPIHLGNNVEALNGTFAYCSNFNSPVTFNFSQDRSPRYNGVFYGCESFNQSISVPNVYSAEYTLDRCSNFNNYVDFSRAYDLRSITRFFYDCRNFNKEIHLSYCDKLYDLYEAFYNCRSFNSNIRLNWDSVEDIRGMMDRCESFGFNCFYESFYNGLANGPNLNSASYAFAGCQNLMNGYNSLTMANNITVNARDCSIMFENADIFRMGEFIFGTRVENLCACFQDTQFIGNIYILNDQGCNVYAMLYNTPNYYGKTIYCHNLAIINKTSARESVTGYDMTWTQQSAGVYTNSAFGITISNQF